MNNPLLIAIVCGLGGMVGWGLADFFAKKTIDKIGDFATLFWGHIFGTVALLVLVLASYASGHQSFELPSTQSDWLYVSIFGVIQAVIYMFVYKGFGKGQLAILNPIFASFSGITALLSILLFKEAVSNGLLVGLGVLLIGIAFISLDFPALKVKKYSLSHVPGIREVIFATFMAAFWTLFWDHFIGGKNWLVYTFFMYAIMTAFIGMTIYSLRIKTNVPESSIWKFLFLIGVCEIGAYLAISIGYSVTSHTSVVALLSGAFSLPTIVLARKYLNEKITKLQTLGSFVIILGIIFLSLS